MSNTSTHFSARIYMASSEGLNNVLCDSCSGDAILVPDYRWDLALDGYQTWCLCCGEPGHVAGDYEEDGGGSLKFIPDYYELDRDREKLIDKHSEGRA